MSKSGEEKLKGFIKECLENRKSYIHRNNRSSNRLKDYETNKDKHFAGTIKLPNIARPHLKVCIIAD